MSFDKSYVDRHLTIWEFGSISQKAQRLRSNFNVNKDRRYYGAELWCWSGSDLFLEYIFCYGFFIIFNYKRKKWQVSMKSAFDVSELWSYFVEFIYKVLFIPTSTLTYYFNLHAGGVKHCLRWRVVSVNTI